MHDRTTSAKPVARYLSGGLRYLRAHMREMLLPLGLLVATEATLQWLWLGQPLGRTLASATVTLPALVLLSIAFVSLGTSLLRLLVVFLVLCVNHAQYTFFAFYGRFLGTGEIRLATSNPPHELLTSVALYFSGPALIASVATTAAYAFVMFRRNETDASYRRFGIALLALVGWCLLVNDAMPRQAFYSPVLALTATNVRLGEEYLRDREAVRPARHAAPAPASAAGDFDVIYLVGESLRADRFQSGAYGRNVTPNLRALKMPHIFFNNVVSHGDCTGRSMPYLMVAPTPPLHVDLYRRPTIFAYAKAAGYRTSFVNANENGWQEFVDDNIDTLHRNAEPGAGFDDWTFRSDTEMLPVISEIANAPNRQFLVIETYTGHWPYADRYANCPDCRVFRPDLLGKPVPFSSTNRARITNSYDNALLYFDRFVASTLRSLKKPTLIVLTSDHGESLGEDNRWGHCSGTIEQMLVPFMLIATDDKVAKAVGFDRLAAKANAAISHDNIFPTLLRIFGYDVGSLEFHYALDLEAVNSDGEPDRSVLTSEIGSGAESVSFSHVDIHRKWVRSETLAPR